mmetsp:Transcript_93098/g.251329  ORF Transcript_93098/g.251329 Transcript_93098/m.251329 type:complete len:348 (+) Transcript_93098:365-1408(+)
MRADARVRLRTRPTRRGRRPEERVGEAGEHLPHSTLPCRSSGLRQDAPHDVLASPRARPRCQRHLRARAAAAAGAHRAEENVDHDPQHLLSGLSLVLSASSTDRLRHLPDLRIRRPLCSAPASKHHQRHVRGGSNTRCPRDLRGKRCGNRGGGTGCLRHGKEGRGCDRRDRTWRLRLRKRRQDSGFSGNFLLLLIRFPGDMGPVSEDRHVVQGSRLDLAHELRGRLDAHDDAATTQLDLYLPNFLLLEAHASQLVQHAVREATQVHLVVWRIEEQLKHLDVTLARKLKGVWLFVCGRRLWWGFTSLSPDRRAVFCNVEEVGSRRATSGRMQRLCTCMEGRRKAVQST